MKRAGLVGRSVTAKVREGKEKGRRVQTPSVPFALPGTAVELQYRQLSGHFCCLRRRPMKPRAPRPASIMA